MKAVLLENSEAKLLTDLLQAEITHRSEIIKKAIRHGSDEAKAQIVKDQTHRLALLIDKLDR